MTRTSNRTASYLSHTRGLMILIHKLVSFKVDNVIGDIGGRYLIVQGTLINEKINVINIYAPNVDNPKFPDETSAIVSWEAFKVYIRGMIISYTSSKTNKTKL